MAVTINQIILFPAICAADPEKHQQFAQSNSHTSLFLTFTKDIAGKMKRFTETWFFQVCWTFVLARWPPGWQMVAVKIQSNYWRKDQVSRTKNNWLTKFNIICRSLFTGLDASWVMERYRSWIIKADDWCGLDGSLVTMGHDGSAGKAKPWVLTTLDITFSCEAKILIHYTMFSSWNRLAITWADSPLNILSKIICPCKVIKYS